MERGKVYWCLMWSVLPLVKAILNSEEANHKTATPAPPRVWLISAKVLQWQSLGRSSSPGYIFCMFYSLGLIPFICLTETGRFWFCAGCWVNWYFKGWNNGVHPLVSQTPCRRVFPLFLLLTDSDFYDYTGHSLLPHLPKATVTLLYI
jgi:hypothetical protein